MPSHPSPPTFCHERKKMRRLFLVLAKLLGLLQAYWALGWVGFVQIGVTISMVGRPESTSVGQIVLSLIGIGTYFLMSIGMAWLLLARTEWLADKLRIRDDANIEEFGSHPALAVGVKLIGVYVTVNAVSGLIRTLVDAQRLWEGQVRLHAWNMIIPAALQLGLGIFLALKTEKVVGIITKE